MKVFIIISDFYFESEPHKLFTVNFKVVSCFWKFGPFFVWTQNFSSFYQLFEYQNIKFVYKNLIFHLAENRVCVRCKKSTRKFCSDCNNYLLWDWYKNCKCIFSGKLRVLAIAAGGTCDYHWTIWKFKMQVAVFLLSAKPTWTRKLMPQSENRTNVCECKKTEFDCEWFKLGTLFMLIFCEDIFTRLVKKFF